MTGIVKMTLVRGDERTVVEVPFAHLQKLGGKVLHEGEYWRVVAWLLP